MSSANTTPPGAARPSGEGPLGGVPSAAVAVDGADGDDGPGNFIGELIAEDVRTGKNGGRVATRFPPEPNGYLHIGHAKSICTNFGLAARFGGTTNLRFDDTNPEAEDVEYVESIENDVRWLGFDWQGRKYFASDYFEKLYELAVHLIEAGKAYVDSRSLEDIRATRGDFYKPGEESVDRNRPVADNLALFAKMRAGELPDGSHVLRAKIDMGSTDVKLRDPVMYRIRRAHHHRTGNAWCIYPMYDWAHGQSDAIEGITHSICTLEFKNHRGLYHWFLDNLPLDYHPEQIEFAKLKLTYTVLSKRKLKELVEGKYVSGWDDPRMPTLAGLRRRGYTAEAIRSFCERIGVSTRDSNVDITLLEHALREHLNATSPRVMAVLRPLKITVSNMAEEEVEWFDAPYDPEKPGGPSRKVPFSRDILIEREDFAEVASKKWFRLAPGQEVRLRYACLLKCETVKKNSHGEVTELVCTWDPASRGGSSPNGRKVKGTLHWLSAKHALPAEIRLYDRLFREEEPERDKGQGVDWKSHLNHASLETVRGWVEPSLAEAKALDRFQFERVGYFCVDVDSKPGSLVYNRTIALRDTWAAIAAKGG
jgi:glutaminyl-tRNA synthetase